MDMEDFDARRIEERLIRRIVNALEQDAWCQECGVINVSTELAEIMRERKMIPPGFIAKKRRGLY
jgi:hypothetical protein